MAENFETVLMLNPDLTEDQIQGYNEEFSNYITENGGNIVKTDIWGKRRLEYPIERQNYAVYVVFYYEMAKPVNLVSEFQRRVRINDDLLREMTVKTPGLKQRPAPTETSFLESLAQRRASSGRGGPRGGRPPRAGGPSPRPAPSGESSGGSGSAPTATSEAPKE